MRTPYCHVWPARLYIFPHYLINGQRELEEEDNIIIKWAQEDVETLSSSSSSSSS